MAVFVGISCFLISLCSLILGLFIYSKNPQGRTHRCYLFMALSISLWCVCYWKIVMLSPDREDAILWHRFLNMGSIFIPVTFLGFVASFLGLYEKNKIVIYLGYLAAVIFTVIGFTTSVLVKDMVPKLSFRLWPVPGKGYVFFMAFFFLYVSYATYLLIKEYFRSSGMRKNQIKYVLVGCSVGFAGGSTNYFLWYDIPIPPLGQPLVIVYVIAIAYAVIKFRAFEIETVIHRTLLWLVSILTLVIPIGIVSVLTSRFFLIKLNIYIEITIFIFFFLLFYYYYSRFRPFIDHIFRRRKYDYSQILSMLSLSLKGILDMEKISREVSNSLKEALYLKKIGIVIKDIKTEKMVPLIREGFENDFQSIPGQDRIVAYLKDKSHIEPELVEVDPALFYIRDSVFYRFLKEEDIPLVLSLVLEEDFIGFIILGKKQNLQGYTLKDIEILQNISVDISLYFYNALHHQDIIEKQRLQQEITLAKNIQENLLPQIPPSVPGISLYGLYVPSRDIGGDYYDFILEGGGHSGRGQDRLYITIGDVSGKGLDAGLVVSSVKSSIMSLIQFISSPRDILVSLNNIIYREIKEQKFVSLLLFMYESSRGVLSYSSCGHERIIVCRKSGNEINLEVIKSGGVILGMLDTIDHYLEESALELKRGDRVFLYTDGATEARNPGEDFYGLERLIESFRSHARLPLKDTINNVYQDIKGFISTRDQYDDITLVGIEKE